MPGQLAQLDQLPALSLEGMHVFEEQLPSNERYYCDDTYADAQQPANPSDIGYDTFCDDSAGFSPFCNNDEYTLKPDGMSAPMMPLLNGDGARGKENLQGSTMQQQVMNQVDHLSSEVQRRRKVEQTNQQLKRDLKTMTQDMMRQKKMNEQLKTQHTAEATNLIVKQKVSNQPGHQLKKGEPKKKVNEQIFDFREPCMHPYIQCFLCPTASPQPKGAILHLKRRLQERSARLQNPR